jgi:iron complex outermembrane receptor protein
MKNSLIKGLMVFLTMQRTVDIFRKMCLNYLMLQGPLPGASILVKGTTNGAQTDFDGKFTIKNVGSNAV